MTKLTEALTAIFGHEISANKAAAYGNYDENHQACKWFASYFFVMLFHHIELVIDLFRLFLADRLLRFHHSVLALVGPHKAWLRLTWLTSIEDEAKWYDLYLTKDFLDVTICTNKSLVLHQQVGLWLPMLFIFFMSTNFNAFALEWVELKPVYA